MKVVVLGGTGQIGEALTKGLRTAYSSADVISCSRSGGSTPHDLKFNVNSSDWSSLGKVDVLINAVGIIEEKGENTFQKAHVGVVKSIIQHSKSLGDPMIIHVSVNGANEYSPSKYASTKGVADDLLMKHNQWNIIRPSFVCTHNTTIVQKVKMLYRLSKWQLGFLPIPAQFLKPKFQPVMVDDIVDLVINFIDKNLNHQLVYATGPEVYTLEDWLNVISKGKIRIVPIPHWFIDKPFRVLIKLFPQIMNEDQYLLMGNDNAHDNQELKTLLGRNPKSTTEFWKSEFI
jgi:uncharacterized protein YbjT (DUF2867 family)